MLPKSYTAFKWVIYTLTTFLFCALQSFVLCHIRVLSVTPFLYPMLPAVVAMYEGPRQGSLYALFFGFLCDLLLPAPFPGFFVVLFPVVGLISGSIAENMRSPGIFCAALVSAIGLLLTSGARVLIHFLSGGEYLVLMSWIALVESLLTLPTLIVVIPLYRGIHRRCASDY